MNSQSRREFLKRTGLTAASALLSSVLPGCATTGKIRTAKNNPPNILFVLTDDQGYGDIGCHGNEKIKTPHLDRFAEESVEFTQFYMCPVCAPTRASLMTGRYNYRTGVVDTHIGRAMMYPDEVTIAEVLQQAGYRTAIFGKWHLGDNYPMRTIDQGFEESIVHRGGGIGQSSSPIGGGSYFDPILQHNGKSEKFKGYCMDIYTNAALKFIEQNADKPFFVYLATNTPHVPLQVSEQYAAPYRAMGLSDPVARLYGMITNIDDNFARLLTRLKELGLEENTIVIFTSDNGADGSISRQIGRYMAGLRGAKGSVYENGIRIPFFIRWPAGFEGQRKIDRIAAHIDIMPTILNACGVKKRSGVKFDGINLMPLLQGRESDWPDRTLYFQWHRGNKPQMFRCFAVRNQKYKLVQPFKPWVETIIKPERFQFELFDISKDPFEQNDISAKHPKMVVDMKRDYERWFKEVSSTRGFEPPPIYLGTTHENPVILTEQDRRKTGIPSDRDLGYWKVKVAKNGKYAVTLRMPLATGKSGEAHFKLADVDLVEPVAKGVAEYTFHDVNLPRGTGQLQAWMEVDGQKLCAKFIDVRILD